MRSFKSRRSLIWLILPLSLVGNAFGTSVSIAASAAAPANASVAFLSTLSRPVSGSPPDVVENYSRIQEQLLLKNPERWGGAYVDGTELVVKAVGMSIPEAEKAIADIGVVRGVRVILADISMAQLEVDSSQVSDAVKGIAGISSVGPQYSSSRIVVGLEKDDSVTRGLLGGVAVKSDIVSYLAPGRPGLTSRYTDVSPFYGGNWTGFGNTPGTAGGCSSGFSWNGKVAGEYMISAGHCFTTPTTLRMNMYRWDGFVYTKYGDYHWSSSGTTGTSSGRHGDIMLYKLAGYQSDPKVFVGPNNTIATRTVNSAAWLAENWTGSTMRTSGAGGAFGNGDGEIDPNWVSLVNQVIPYNDGQTMNTMNIVEHVSDCVGGGDSGGAVYLQNTGLVNATAVGIISGSNNSGGGLYNCRSYYTPVGYMTIDYGCSIKTP